MIQVMKASAGSGKTFNLAKKYIGIVLTSEDRYAYRGVLAVTFTTKATAEMKSRILKELRILATEPEKSDYLEDFVPSPFASAGALQKKAESVLVDILHDYGAFSISTIDKFFQQTLKAFAREIGQFSAYQIELDRDSLIHESVDRILDALTEQDTKLLAWLNDSVSEQLEKGGRIDLEGGLYKMAERLASEEHEALAGQYGIDDETSLSKESLAAIRKECRQIVAAFEKDTREAAQAVCVAMDEAGVALSETKSAFLGAVTKWTALKPGDPIPRPTAAFLVKAGDPDQWFAQSKAARLLPRVRASLSGPLSAFCALFDAPYSAYGTARVLLKQLYGLGLAREFQNEFRNLLKEKNVLSIDDSNTLLRKIIDGSDAPFVYEKMGVRYRHFLLDEFQDTSTVQWENFYPLLKESSSSGNGNLVVGDVKQSIYRWRGSDWELLERGVQVSFPEATVEPLRENWRSAKAVVDFNNAFFPHAAALLQQDSQDAAFDITRLYADVAQIRRSSEEQDGQVKVLFCDKEQELSAVLDSIRSMREHEARWGDIAVLVRNNKEGGEVASFLVGEGVPVISDDSLEVKSSVVVRRLVALLDRFENPGDEVSAFLASELDIRFPERFHSLSDLCEALLRELQEHDPALYEGETLYIQSFMDSLQDWCKVNGNNLRHFLDYWKEAKDKVSSPDDADAVRVITIHKSKGLEFPAVIFPFAEKVDLKLRSNRWCHLAAESPFQAAGQAIYAVDMTSSALNTLFAGDYRDERNLNLVDNLNTFYVALTRAKKVLHVIACHPPQALLTGKSNGVADLSQVLYAFLKTETYESGAPYDFSRMKRSRKDPVTPVPASYPSFPVNHEAPAAGDDETAVGERGRLKFSSDSADFFALDGRAGVEASVRRKGIALHDILSRVTEADDLPGAVALSVANGTLSPAEGEEAASFLRERIRGPQVRAWFGLDPDVPVLSVSRERSLIDTDGSVCRPDRVVETAQGWVVIDYKFGEPRRHYGRQVARYVDLYRRMGCTPVRGFLWYVETDTVVSV